MKKGWSTGKIIGVIAGGIAAVFILWVAFVASVYQLITFFDKMEEESNDEYEWSYDYEYRDEDDAADKDRQDDQESDDRDRDSIIVEGGNIGDEEYYEFESDIREDLSYQMTIRSYEKDDFSSEQGGRAEISFEYAVMSGEAPNLEGIPPCTAP